MYDIPGFSRDSLSSRTTSGFPISIGTSLALESLFMSRQDPYDPQREIPQSVDVSKYDEIWINLSTMFRNIVGASFKEAIIVASEEEFKDTLNQEIEIINDIFSNEGQNQCKPVYYYCTYEKLHKKRHNIVSLRSENTEPQKIVKYKMDKTLELLFKETEEHFKFDSDIKPKSKTKAMIFTHIPFDLLSHKNFNDLHLLEGHTGKLKPRFLWYTKYYPVGDEDLSSLPFNRTLLMVFGDRALIQPGNIKLRRTILDVAEKGNWTPMTTEAKMMMDFEMYIKEPFVVKTLKEL